MPGSLPVPDPIDNPLDCTAPTTSAAILIDKTDISTGPYTLGDNITYQVSLSNTGGAGLFNATLVDTLSSIKILDDPLGLMSGGGACINANWVTNIIYDYIVTDADITAGSISNTATLSSPLLSASATHELFNIFGPGVISGSKVETSTGPYTVGDTVSFQVSVSNIGESTVNNVNLSDSLSPINLISDPLLILSQGITLQPLSSASVLYDYIVTESDVTTGTISNSACITSDLGEICYTSYVTEDNLAQRGKLVVVKTEDSSGPYIKGDVISYQVDVTNIGGKDVTDIILYDSLPNITFTSDISGLSAGNVTLVPGASAVVTYNHTIINENVAIGSVTNIASITSDLGVTPSNTVIVNDITIPGRLAAIKTVLGTGGGSGGVSSNDNITLWEPGDLGYDATNLFRNKNAKYVLPSEDEWYKAAYYDGVNKVYWDYPTGSNSEPTAVLSGTLSGTSVYNQAGPADVDNCGGLSPYGTMGQGGNVWEWSESVKNQPNNDGDIARIYRGGSWSEVPSFPQDADQRSFLNPVNEINTFGFRVAVTSEAPPVVPIEWVTISEAGNTADDTTYGAVGYEYRISKYTIRESYIDEYNAANPTLQITLDERGDDKPATNVSWNEAARFVNWLNVSEGYTPAYKFSGVGANNNIELWTVSDSGYDASNLYRNSNAKYFLPSEDEWYKAAYYKRGGTNAGYWDYATGSDGAPTAVLSGSLSGTAVYDDTVIDPIPAGPADVTQAGGLSPYGTMGQGGNVFELTESAEDGINSTPTRWRAFRGGNWEDTANILIASNDSSRGLPGNVSVNDGFRVAAKTQTLAPACSIDFVTIGDVTNINDTEGGGYGGVNYEYGISKYAIPEHCIDAYNTANPSIPITKDSRGPNKPATSISWNEAARFVNWLNVSEGYQPAYKFTPGSYTTGDTITYSVNVTNSGGTTVTSIKLTDSLPNITYVSGNNSLLTGGVTLSSGDTSEVVYNYVVTAGDIANGVINNTATITSSVATVTSNTIRIIDLEEFVDPGELNIVKTVESAGPYTVNDTITYKVIATTVGITDTVDMKLTDSLNNITFTSDVSGLSAGGVTLIPGASAEVVYDYIITESDISNELVTNTAIISSVGGVTTSNTVVTELSGIPEPPSSDQFIFIVDTRIYSFNAGRGSLSDEFKLPLLRDGVYDFVVDWGDGTFDTITQWDDPKSLHKYVTGGIKTITITGLLEGWGFLEAASTGGVRDEDKYINTVEWTGLRITDNSDFWLCRNYTGSINAVGVPTIVGTSLDYMFYGAYKFNGDVSNWDVSNVTSMFRTFYAAYKFNKPLSSWDVSNVTDMTYMFGGAFFFNQPIGNWDVSSVVNMSGMFSDAYYFNQPIGNWDVSSVVNMFGMFLEAHRFNQDISSWNISNVAYFGSFLRYIEQTQFPAPEEAYGVDILPAMRFSVYNLTKAFDTWATLPALQPDVEFDTSVGYYTAPGANILTSPPNNWTITYY